MYGLSVMEEDNFAQTYIAIKRIVQANHWLVVYLLARPQARVQLQLEQVLVYS